MNKLERLHKLLADIEHELKHDFRFDKDTALRNLYLIRRKHEILDELEELENEPAIKKPLPVIEDEPEEFEDDGFLQMVLWYVIFGGKIPKFLTLTNSFYELLIRAHTTKPKTKF